MRYEIADLLVEMSPGGRTAVQAEAYRVSAWDRPPDITIRVDRPSALACYPELKSGDQAEYLATGDRFALGLLRCGGLVLHAAAVELLEDQCGGAAVEDRSLAHRRAGGPLRRHPGEHREHRRDEKVAHDD